MSKRKSYWYAASNGATAGPFASVGETKEAAAEKKDEAHSIRTVIEIERFVDGQWHTVH